MTFLFVEMMFYLLLLVFHCINGLLIFDAEKDLVTMNDSVKLICKSSSIQLELIKGLENVGRFDSVFNQLVNNDQSRWNITGSSDGMVLVLNVTVLRFLSRDVGLYTCKVNRTFAATAELKMAVGVSFVKLTPTFDPVNVQENITRQFQCVTSEARPYASVSWFKDGVNITSSATSTTVNDITTSTLNMTPVRSDQDSKLYCLARNGGSVVDSTKQPQIEVLYTPSKPTCGYMTNTISTPLKIPKGAMFSITCSSSGNPQPSFTWKYPGASSAKELAPIQISRINDGIFTVTASNLLEPSGLPPISASNYMLINVTVLYEADIAEFDINRSSKTIVTITQGDLWEAICVVDSNPGANITLFRNNKDVHKTENSLELTYSKTAQCEIDIGNYTCTASNFLNIHPSSKHLQLFVKCSARKPTGVVVKLIYTARQHENVTLWYTIAAYPVPKPSQFVWKGCTNASNGSCNNSLDGMLKYNVKSEGLSSFLTIRDVEIEYYGMYQLSVSNGIGSPFIEWLHLIPIGKPESPSDFHVIQEEIRETSAVLTWVPGFDNGSPQTFYITYTKKGDLSGWITMSIQHTHEAQMNYTLRSLEPETEYIASIYASNENGFSPTINDTFITLKHIPDISGEQEDSHAGLIGGSVGGIAAVLVIIAVVFIVKKFRTSAKPAGQSDRAGKDSHGCKAAQASEQMITATDTSVYDAIKNGDNRSGTDSPGCNAAQHYEKLSKEIDTSDYDALKKGNNGSGTDSPRYNAAQAYEELSMKTETSVYDALKKGNNGPDNSHVYTSLDESKSQPPMYYGNVKKEDPVYNNTVL